MGSGISDLGVKAGSYHLIAEPVSSSAPMAFSYFTNSLRNDEPSASSKAQERTQTWTAMTINEK